MEFKLSPIWMGMASLNYCVDWISIERTYNWMTLFVRVTKHPSLWSDSSRTKARNVRNETRCEAWNRQNVNVNVKRSPVHTFLMGSLHFVAVYLFKMQTWIDLICYFLWLVFVVFVRHHVGWNKSVASKVAQRESNGISYLPMTPDREWVVDERSCASWVAVWQRV